MSRLALAGVIFLYLVLSAVSSYVTELRFGPDEPAHFIYVREIAHFRMPALAHEVTPDISGHASHEAHQPPLYYALAAIPYFAAAALGADVDTTWRILRLFAVLIGAGWVYFLYRLSSEFLGGRRYHAVLAAAVVGLLPSAVYMGGVVNNDALCALIFTAGLWLVFKCVRRGEIRRRDAIHLGMVCGLGMLTKAQGIFLILLVGIAALMIAHRRGWKTSASTLGNSAAAILLGLLIGSVWFLRNWLVYGSPMIQSLYDPLPGCSIFVLRIITDQLFKFFWTPFWLIGGFVDDMLYCRLLLAFCVLILAGVAAHLKACGKRENLDCRLDAWVLLALPALLIYVFLVRHTLLVDRGALQQGRLLLPASGGLGIAVAVALGAFARRPALRAVVGSLLVAGLITADVLVLRAIAAFYAFY